MVHVMTSMVSFVDLTTGILPYRESTEIRGAGPAADGQEV